MTAQKERRAEQFGQSHIGDGEATSNYDVHACLTAWSEPRAWMPVDEVWSWFDYLCPESLEKLAPVASPQLVDNLCPPQTPRVTKIVPLQTAIEGARFQECQPHDTWFDKHGQLCSQLVQEPEAGMPHVC